ncbi:MAG: hypothetical protein J5733_00610, partial [Bacteroidaceae bacterium]|nr:hypothetical protein [Bacteroidaceae bacterium]
VDCYAAYLVTLANSSDNTTLIESLDGKENCNVVLEDRTFYRNNTWNTICLPFDTEIAGSPLEGADVRTLSGITREGETVTLIFSDEGTINEIKAGRPYIIKWDNTESLVEPLFTGVTIDKTKRDIVCVIDNDVPGSPSIGVTFKGTYSYIAFTDTDDSILFVGATNRLNYPLSGATIGAQKAFFQLEGITANAAISGVKRYVLDFGEDNPTIIHEIANDNSADGEWYDINGRKLSGKPSLRGVYIQNDKKVLVK